MRIIGIDLARFIAILGMMAAHLLVPRRDSGSFGDLDWLTVVTSGIPSAMFAVIGGFGVFLTSRKYLYEGARGRAVTNLVVRGALITGIGVVLDLLPDHPIAVILVFFGVAITCVGPLILLPSWTLALIAAALPFLGVVGGYNFARTFTLSTVFEAQTLPEAAVALFFTGYYPALTWLSYLLIGVIAARFLLGARGHQVSRRAGYLAIAGALGFAVAQAVNLTVIDSARAQLAELWGYDPSTGTYLVIAAHRGVPLLPPGQSLWLAAPHSGSPVDVLSTAGIALMITGVLVLITAGLKEVPLVLKPFVWTGAVPLTAYSLHIVLTSFTWSQGALAMERTGTYPAWFAAEFWIQLAIILGIGIVIGLSGRRGPLEIFVSRTAENAANSVRAPISAANS